MGISKSHLIIAIVLSVLMVMLPSQATEKLRIIGEDSFPHYNYYVTDGKKIKKEIKGFTVELIKLILSDIGIKNEATIELFTWARVLKIIEKEPNVLILDIVRNPDREELYKWLAQSPHAKYGCIN